MVDVLTLGRTGEDLSGRYVRRALRDLGVGDRHVGVVDGLPRPVVGRAPPDPPDGDAAGLAIPGRYRSDAAAGHARALTYPPDDDAAGHARTLPPAVRGAGS